MTEGKGKGSKEIFLVTSVRIFPSCIMGLKDPGSGSKNLSIFQPKKLFLISRKYDLGCSSRIPFLIFFSTPDPGSRVQKSTGSGSATLLVRRSGWWTNVIGGTWLQYWHCYGYGFVVLHAHFWEPPAKYCSFVNTENLFYCTSIYANVPDPNP